MSVLNGGNTGVPHSSQARYPDASQIGQSAFAIRFSPSWCADRIQQLDEPEADVVRVELDESEHRAPVVPDHPVQRVLRGEPQQVSHREHVRVHDLCSHRGPERGQPERLDLGGPSKPALLVRRRPQLPLDARPVQGRTAVRVLAPLLVALLVDPHPEPALGPTSVEGSPEPARARPCRAVRTIRTRRRRARRLPATPGGWATTGAAPEPPRQRRNRLPGRGSRLTTTRRAPSPSPPGPRLGPSPASTRTGPEPLTTGPRPQPRPRSPA